MNCKKIRKYLSDQMDGRLEEKSQKILKSHLEKCTSCRAYQRSLEKIQMEISSFKKPELAPGYWKDFHFRLKTKLQSLEPEKRTFSPFILGRKWAWTTAAVIVAVALGVFLLFFQAKKSQEIYVFSFEDSLEHIFQEIGDNQELANLFNLVILASIEENLGPSPLETKANLYDDPFFWESLTEEEIDFLESEIKKETKS